MLKISCVSTCRVMGSGKQEATKDSIVFLCLFYGVFRLHAMFSIASHQE